jgi:hypothetical protein
MKNVCLSACTQPLMMIASSMAAQTQRIVASNGLDGVVRVLQGRVEDIQLPTKAWYCLLSTDAKPGAG